MQDQLAKERFAESIFDSQVQAKLRDLQLAALKDTLDEAFKTTGRQKPRKLE